jgi:glycosyltransferase involved in cell wall biosynthesis
MWLLNHTTLRAFEIPQLSKAGVTEIYTPKKFPWDEGNLSASITYDYDKELTIPSVDLEILNSQDWYGEPNKKAWDIANKYFDVLFIGFFPDQIKSASKNFLGSIILRAFGLGGEETYSKLIQKLDDSRLYSAINQVKNRFWFGMGYQHLADSEEELVSSRSVYMPVGLKNIKISNEWIGSSKQILFICPRIGSSPYFFNVYKKFINNFKDFPFCIGGAQPIDVDDPNVLGFLSNDRYTELMKNSRVMFYHSVEINHIHYHPFEAVRAGIPLIFMAGGMLDLLGGKNLPGRATSIEDAKTKIRRILNDDTGLINNIKNTQNILLECMDPQVCEIPWRENFERIISSLKSSKVDLLSRRAAESKCRIAVIIPVEYRGGSLRGAKLLAQALKCGAEQGGVSVDVVMMHLDDSQIYPQSEFDDLPSAIRTRRFKWRTLKVDEARRAMRYAGHAYWEPSAAEYLVVDDGIKQLEDCDLWVVVSDRISAPLLPLRPVVHMVFDYLQRYVPILPHGADQPFINAARAAAQVWTTTEFTRQDALQYAGIEPKRVVKLPMLAPLFEAKHHTNRSKKPAYFIWTTNASLHKNHTNALRALQIYYDDLNGSLDCHITGVDSQKLLKAPPEFLKRTMTWVQANESLKKRLHWLGELDDFDFQCLLQEGYFLWHPASIDNGTFSVVEAATLGLPSLSSNYPPMCEIDKQFSLNLAWMDASDPLDMARALKEMEEKYLERRGMLPTVDQLATQSIEQLAQAYWTAASSCL